MTISGTINDLLITYFIYIVGNKLLDQHSLSGTLPPRFWRGCQLTEFHLDPHLNLGGKKGGEIMEGMGRRRRVGEKRGQGMGQEKRKGR